MKRRIIRKAGQTSNVEGRKSTPVAKRKVSETKASPAKSSRRKVTKAELPAETAPSETQTGETLRKAPQQAKAPIRKPAVKTRAVAQPQSEVTTIRRARSRRTVAKDGVTKPATTQPPPEAPIATKAEAAKKPYIAEGPALPIKTTVPPMATPELPSIERPQQSEAAGSRSVPREAPAGTGLTSTFKLPVPAILLEGDQPTPPQKSGPGEKFALASSAAKEPALRAESLPPVYGTGAVNTVARDPYCLYVSWDFSDSQQRYYNSLSADKHLVLRAHHGSLSGPVATEAHLHGETRHWFLHVPRASAQYVVEIGYYLTDGAWITVRSGEPVMTQPDRPSEDQTVRFAYAGSFTTSARSVEAHLGEPPLPGPLLQRRRGDEQQSGGVWESHPTIITPVLPESRPPVDYPSWTAAQEEALTELIGTMIRREQVPGSIELLELLQRQVRRPAFPLEEELGLPGPSSAALGISSPGPGEIPSSPAEAQRLPPRKGFWFNVNAELIIYGATEPDARVTIGGRPIKLRPDGTFSYRFALPDGYYDLPAEATSADNTDSRRAELRFSRQTLYSGDVGAHPQDKALRIPAPENVE
jgi:hypothetical protein